MEFCVTLKVLERFAPTLLLGPNDPVLSLVLFKSWLDLLQIRISIRTVLYNILFERVENMLAPIAYYFLVQLVQVSRLGFLEPFYYAHQLFHVILYFLV